MDHITSSYFIIIIIVISNIFLRCLTPLGTRPDLPIGVHVHACMRTDRHVIHADITTSQVLSVMSQSYRKRLLTDGAGKSTNPLCPLLTTSRQSLWILMHYDLMYPLNS